MSKVIKDYPASMSTVSIETLVDTTIKRRVLKAISTYVVDEAKKRDIKDINKSLGNLLEFKTQITTSPEAYMAGVVNMFNVQIKALLINQNPELAGEFKSKLKCNERSELIPASKRVAVLSSGVSGEIAAKDEESEEMRKEREKEAQDAALNMSILEELERQLQEDTQDKVEEEIDEAESKKLQQQEEELLKQENELEELKKEQEEFEALYRSLSNRKDD